MKHLEIAQKALKQIASCEMKVKGDVVDIARQALPALSAHEAEVKELVQAAEAMVAHYSGSLDHQPPYVRLMRAALAKVKP